jgi:hypothetical protein
LPVVAEQHHILDEETGDAEFRVEPLVLEEHCDGRHHFFSLQQVAKIDEEGELVLALLSVQLLLDLLHGFDYLLSDLP